MNIVPFLYSWDKSHLIMMYDIFHVLLDAICQYVAEDFSIYVHQQYWPEVFLFVMSLSGFGVRMMLAS